MLIMDDVSVKNINLTDEANISNIYKLMDHYALKRYNGDVHFGKDEFPDKDAKRSLLVVSDSYMVNYIDTGTQIGYVIVTPSLYFWATKAAYADVRLILCGADGDEKHLEKLMKVAIDMTYQLNYEACLFETFLSNVGTLLTARAAGFRSIAVTPQSGYVFDEGWQDSVLLMNEVRDVTTCLPHRKHEPGNRVWDKKFSPQNQETTLKYPLENKTKTGKTFLVSPALEEEAQAIHDIFSDAAENSTGFDTLAIGTVEELAKIIKETHRIMAFTIKSPDEPHPDLVGAFFISPWVYSRSVKPVWCEYVSAINKKYHNTGVSKANVGAMRKIQLSLGYRGMMCCTIINNKPSIRLQLTSPLSCNKVFGVLPYTSHLNKTGWIDALLMVSEWKPESKI